MSMLSLFRIVFLLVFVNSFMTDARMTLPGCRGSCGSIRIPSINAEILKFSLDWGSNSNILVVKGPIISSNCSSREESTIPPLNLTGSPYIFSRINSFFSFGCNTHATMTLIRPEIVGCESTCIDSVPGDSNRQVPRSACNGTNCCETVIPAGLEDFGIKLEKKNISITREDECRLGFITNQTWLQSTYEKVDLMSSVMNLDSVPVVLKWNTITNVLMNSTEIIDCYQLTDPQYSIAWECVCRAGYQGNPYIPNGEGCEDIDECKGTQNNCNSGATCVNTVGSFRCQEDKTWMSVLGICLGFGVFLALAGLWRLHKFIRKTKQTKLKKKFFQRNGSLLLQQQLSSNELGNIDTVKVFTSKELEKATDSFNCTIILGQGGQGTVYKGMLVDGRIVAVKKSKLVDEPNLGGFINEIVILSQINHRNVVKLLGICLETQVPILVYEFIPNGTLYQFLHPKNDDASHHPIPWRTRLGIATEIAGALSYLHFSATSPIFHRDVKTMNILLDDKYRAILSDFGTSRSVSIDLTHLSTKVRGTFGYFDPEYFQSSKLTDKSDVYSFGVVLVELLTGLKPISSPGSEEIHESLVARFLFSVEENNLFDIIDPIVKQDYREEECLAFADVARRCLHLNGKKRPSMKEVHMELEQISCFSQKGKNAEEIEKGLRSCWENDSSSFGSGFLYNSATFSLEMEPLITDSTVSILSRGTTS
ncbi:hypothetical protein ACFE04_031604 [Oxalis oulophora]